MIKIEKMSDLVGRQAGLDQALKILESVKSQLAGISEITGDLPTGELNETIEVLRKQANSLAAEIEARYATLEPYRKAYFNRTLELPQKINSIKYQIEAGEVAVRSQRQKLMDAGVDLNDVIRIAPAFNAEPLLRELSGLEAELESWELFNETGLKQYLPVDADMAVERFGKYDPSQVVISGRRRAA